MNTPSSQPPVVSPERLNSAYTYATYRQLITALQAEGKTTGPNQSEMLTSYTRLNVQRMERLDKKVELLPELHTALAKLTQNYAWVILTEGWCGDAAQIVPVLEKVAQASNGRFTTYYLLRDENLDLMDQYLTNGGRSIPKLIMLHADTLTEVAQWGPRPAPAHDLFLEMKAQGISHEDFVTRLHGWYTLDKTQTTQRELLHIIEHMA